MGNKSFYLSQTVFQQSHPNILVKLLNEDALNEQILHAFLGTVSNLGAVGIAPAYGPKSVLVLIALSSLTNVLLVRLSKTRSHGKAKGSGRKLLQDLIFCNVKISKYAFRMDRISAALFLDLDCRIVGGIDMLSVFNSGRDSWEATTKVMGGTGLNKKVLMALFKGEENAKTTSCKDTALQAWSACQAASLPTMINVFAAAPRVNTQYFEETHLAVLSKTIRDSQQLIGLKPCMVKNEVESDFTADKGVVKFTCTRFKTRIMPISGNQNMHIETIENGKRSFIEAYPDELDGRSATLSLKGSLSDRTVKAVRTIGREAPTAAEVSRVGVILTALQGTNTILNQPFVKLLWLPLETLSWAGSVKYSPPVQLVFPSPRQLNPSQKDAVNAILSTQDTSRVVVIQGPPGTGKTTVIAATVSSVLASRDLTRTLWLVAQSNVAVKNIAGKLAEIGGLSFKILVSKDFHYDWHEHLYEQIAPNLIRSDTFESDIVAAERRLGDSRVILCTLSMLSNPKLGNFTRLVEPQTIIFDEASQIDIGDYFPMLSRFRTTLRKLVFIGDHKQLAPYGQSDIEELQSIFEMPHLLRKAIFLDTQYRMPTPIGNFISAKVYDNRLKSEHKVKASKSCQFIDVANGKEERQGSSWTNISESKVVVSIAKTLNAAGKSYRIITPYDAQRCQLENALKSSKLPWEDKCFNVDSFQGNEDDHIIISVVRSEKIGFLREKRRVNVMLTRCKIGMIICTNRAFVEGKARQTLVGALAKSLGKNTWVSSKLVLNGNFTPFKC